MKYVNADVLPKELLSEVQKYVSGVAIYVPKPEGVRKGWGMNSGGRKFIDLRNDEIRRKFSQGATVNQLSNEYFLSGDTIKKIVYSKAK